MNKEAATKEVIELLIHWLSDFSLRTSTANTANKIVDAVIGELFGYKAERAEDCWACKCLKYDSWDNPLCILGDGEIVRSIGELYPACSTGELYPTCPKPERPKGEV